MTLAEFMDAEGLDDTAMGALIKKSRVTVSRYRRKLETPSSDTVKAIVELSKGRVPADELLGIQIGSEVSP